jgi:hypothetical protein
MREAGPTVRETIVPQSSYFASRRITKLSPTVGVFLANGVLGAWERNRARRFSTIEQYAIAKMALFQSFDERAAPAEMGEPVLVRAADLDPSWKS